MEDVVHEITMLEYTDCITGNAYMMFAVSKWVYTSHGLDLKQLF